MNKLLWAESLLAMTCCSWTSEARAPGAPVPLDPRDRYDELILGYAQKHRLNPKMVKAMIAVESEFSPRAVSTAGARGLMQLLPTTAEEMGVERARLGDPESNIAAGTAYLGRLSRSARARYGVPEGRPLPAWLARRVVAAYHGGPRNLARDHWAASTRAYVRRVLGLARSRASSLRARRDFSDS